uniref:Uncharacterized protein n=1 Tax=Arundo donax TaxID=35708 RepID=A0A0A9C8C1_ARUDO
MGGIHRSLYRFVLNK